MKTVSAFIAATTFLSPCPNRFFPAHPYLLPRTRIRTTTVTTDRPFPSFHHPLRASLDDAGFFLPSDGRDPSHAPSSKESAHMSIAARRVAEKAKELSDAASNPDEEEEELRRSQIVGEQLSAADLFSSADLSTSDLTSADLSISDLPSLITPETQSPQGFEQSEKPTSQQPTALSKQSEPVSHSTRRRRKRPASEETIIKSLNSTSNQTSSKTTRSPETIQTNRLSQSTLDSSTGNNGSKTLTIGDLVKHQRHGIGRFIGLERTRRNINEEPGPVQEFLVLEYRDGDVYVPLSHLELIERISDSEARLVPRLDVIASTASYPPTNANKRRANYTARQRTREKIRKQIVNLHAMYAQRTTLDREPIPIDPDAEQAFSNHCEFELTDDQVTATNQVFHDMSSNRRPMDRLLCGDVGFGKTEVAIRAAFRAICAGMQVAVLAPTTILAQQHFETFRERFSMYPDINIACLTRFVPRRKILEARSCITEGSIDIAIGTHMILSDHVQFRKLGLLIVDEEHRFGVNQKEKIRARYRTIDSLFLSATPIPRTLHLALSGLRDASVLRTPPRGRKPVVTKTSRLGAGVVREAISKEIRRNGQVFYVVPRIEGIEGSANWIADLVPDLRVLIAHGGMSDLEQRILAFSHREYDVLICTTIIENGINMPDVNTIIIQDANKFGLAQLHQLRGRVGRSDIQAYAWVLYSDTQADNLAAIERLKTLEKHSSLGSGFAIAQRDMEMRGVGTVLGVEQHGNNSVNADEYAKMLAEELEHARTGKPIPITLPTTMNVEIFLPVASLIPEEYVSDLEEKMRVYQRLAEARSYEKLDSEVEQLERERGPLPTALQKHVSILRVKMCARQLGIRRVLTERQHVILEWAVQDAAFKRLAMFLPDNQSRSRCEHLEAEERVVIRGLGICSGDVQLTKVLEVVSAMSRAAEGLQNEAKEAQPALARALDNWGGSSILGS